MLPPRATRPVPRLRITCCSFVVRSRNNPLSSTSRTFATVGRCLAHNVTTTAGSGGPRLPRLLMRTTGPGCGAHPTLGYRHNSVRQVLQIRGKRTSRVVMNLDELPQGMISLDEPLVAGSLAEEGAETGQQVTKKTRKRRAVKKGGEDASAAAEVEGEEHQQQEQENHPQPLGDGDSGLNDNIPAYPTVVLQARRNMDKFENCVLLTRVGGFYEMYFEHAEEYGPLLNLKVAQKKFSAGTVPMAGFPIFQLDRFLRILVQDLNRHVAIAEEFKNDASDKIKSGGLMHNRRVARIVTPGTLIDENFMDPYSNNYVMAIHVEESTMDNKDPDGDAVAQEESRPKRANGAGKRKKKSEAAEGTTAASSIQLGLAWLDLSTGYFFTQPTTLSSLGSVLSRVSPREVVLDKAIEEIIADETTTTTTDNKNPLDIQSLLSQEGYLFSYSPQPPGNELRTLSSWTPMLEAEIPTRNLDKFTDNEIRAGALLLHYVKDRLQGHQEGDMNLKLLPPVRYESLQVMAIDKNTMRALEIKQTIRDGGFRGSLLHAIRRTVTRGGARLLNEWLSSPSTSLEVINHRQDLVARFIADEDLRDSVIALLRRSHDSQRLVQKFALNRGDHDDLLRLASTIRATEDIVSHLLLATTTASPSVSSGENGTNDCLSAMIKRISLEAPLKLASQIQKAIDEEGLVQQHELEDSEADEVMALAQEIVKTEGTEEDETLLPKGAAAAATITAKIKTKKSSTETTAAPVPTKRSAVTSLKEMYAEDNELWIMKPAASRRLRTLHSELSALKYERTALTETLRELYNASSLTLRWTSGLGHICHVKGKDAKLRRTSSIPTVDDDSPFADGGHPLEATKTLTASRSTRSFHHPQWTDLGRRLDQTRTLIRAEEQRVFVALRAKVVQNLVKLRRNALVLDELDIATSFAKLAVEQNLTRPIVLDSNSPSRGKEPAAAPGPGTIIIGGRHPTVEGGLSEQGRTFQRNDCLVGAPGHGRIWLITGPNMAGKSTFLRQNALITILAQIGCYVPADHVELGIVDAIFSRVGSADNLYRDQSTFMVEMLETADILRQATPRSFVIMDEIGRGTTPEDGTAISFATLHHLMHVNKSRVLFATHFHAVGDLVEEWKMGVGEGQSGGIEMYCTDVLEDDNGGFIYVHKLRKGINRQSHALKVARLAGLPRPAMDIAQQLLAQHEGRTSHYHGVQHNGAELVGGIGS